jgi:dTDP-4-dehydrorhamnose reductase
MKILLIGANGQVGYEFARQSASHEVVATTRTGQAPIDGLGCVALDVGDVHAIRRLIVETGPDVVVNASGYTAVDRAESEPVDVFKINADAPKAIAEACLASGARLVHYSTDYVFDGSAREPYRIDSPTGPLGVYGRSKLEGEQAILASGANALIVRTAWVYSMRGHSFLTTMLRKRQHELRVVDDQVGCPTPAWLLAKTTLNLLEKDAPAGIQHVVTRGAVSWHGFATAIFDVAVERHLLERAPRVLPIPSSEFPTPAKRPAYSVLDTGGLERLGIAMPEWRAALVETFEREEDAARALLG